MLTLQQIATVLFLAAMVSTFAVMYIFTVIEKDTIDVLGAVAVAILAIVIGTYKFKTIYLKEVFVMAAMVSTLILGGMSFYYYFITNETSIAGGFFAMGIVPVAVYLGI